MTAPDGTAETGAVQRAAAFLKALHARDVEPIRSLVTDDVVQVVMLSPEGGVDPAVVFEGKDAVLGCQATIIDSFSSIDLLDVVTTVGADGRVVVVEGLGERVHRDSGTTYRNRYLLKFEDDGSLISRITEYSNPVTFARFFDLPVG